MTLWAKIVGDIVENIIDDSGLQSGFIDTQEGIYIETSNSIRKNLAFRGMIYDSTRDVFYLSKPYASWTLNDSTCQWEAPLNTPDGYDSNQMPTGEVKKPIIWDEDLYQADNTKGWVIIE
jgi:hypothetical protein